MEREKKLWKSWEKVIFYLNINKLFLCDKAACTKAVAAQPQQKNDYASKLKDFFRNFSQIVDGALDIMDLHETYQNEDLEGLHISVAIFRMIELGFESEVFERIPRFYNDIIERCRFLLNRTNGEHYSWDIELVSYLLFVTDVIRCEVFWRKSVKLTRVRFRSICEAVYQTGTCCRDHESKKPPKFHENLSRFRRYFTDISPKFRQIFTDRNRLRHIINLVIQMQASLRKIIYLPQWMQLYTSWVCKGGTNANIF